jgi:hypothetical protein
MIAMSDTAAVVAILAVAVAALLIGHIFDGLGNGQQMSQDIRIEVVQRRPAPGPGPTQQSVPQMLPPTIPPQILTQHVNPMNDPIVAYYYQQYRAAAQQALTAGNHDPIMQQAMVAAAKHRAIEAGYTQ